MIVAAEDYLPFDFLLGGAEDDPKEVVVGIDRVVHETEKAWLVQARNSRVGYWLPKSQCCLHEDRGYVAVPLWLWEQRSPVRIKSRAEYSREQYRRFNEE